MLQRVVSCNTCSVGPWLRKSFKHLRPRHHFILKGGTAYFPQGIIPISQRFPAPQEIVMTPPKVFEYAFQLALLRLQRDRIDESLFGIRNRFRLHCPTVADVNRIQRR